MNKRITSIGYEIPGKDDSYVDFQEAPSLMDADVLLISPDSISPLGEWVSFTSSDGGCYNVEASKSYIQKVNHLRKEIVDHLKAGKSVFIFLTQEENKTLASGVSSPRKGQNCYRLKKMDTNVLVKNQDGGVGMGKIPNKRYTKEFREEAVKLCTEGGLSVLETVRRLSLPKSTLENWIRKSKDGKLGEVGKSHRPLSDVERELLDVKRELALTKMERDILKKQPRTLRRSRCEVRDDKDIAALVSGSSSVSYFERCPKRFLCMVQSS